MLFHSVPHVDGQRVIAPGCSGWLSIYQIAWTPIYSVSSFIRSIWVTKSFWVQCVCSNFVLLAYLKTVIVQVSDVDHRCQLPIMTWNCWMNLQLARMQSSCGISAGHQLNYPFWIDCFEWYRYQRSNDKSHWTAKSPGPCESLNRIQIGVNRYIGMQELSNFVTRLSTTAFMQLHLCVV